MSGADDAAGGGFEEQFRAWSLINEVVEAVGAGAFAFFHPGIAAAQIGDAGGPYFLLLDGGQDFLWTRRLGAQAGRFVNECSRRIGNVKVTILN